MGLLRNFYFVYSFHKQQKEESISDDVCPSICMFQAKNQYKNFVKSNMNAVPEENIPSSYFLVF
jgi:hypothetical protein